MRAFITGSHAYDTPNEHSDVDLVIQVSEQDKRKLMELRDDYEGRGPNVIRFGKLNLVVCTEEVDMAVWKMGTEKMRIAGERPTKTEAKEELDELRGMVGRKDFGDSDDSGRRIDVDRSQDDGKPNGKRKKRPKPKSKSKKPDDDNDGLEDWACETPGNRWD